jgi:hypothetical protein
MLLLNCRVCDDVLTLTEQPRSCSCGNATGQLLGQLPIVKGARLLELSWESYDKSKVGSRLRLVVLKDVDTA